MATRRKRNDKRSDGQDVSDEELLVNDDPSESVPDISRVDAESDEPVFRRRPTNHVKSKYESLDYDVCENEFWKKDQLSRESSLVVRKDFARWMIFVVIGVFTALIACFVDISIEEFSSYKYTFLKQSVDKNTISGNLYIPYLLYILTNIIPVAIGSMLVTYIEPVAAGSGVPIMKCYLNGVKIPRIVRIKTLFVKVVGVITSVVGGLAGGKEGPMIHAGAVVAAGVSQGKSTTFRRDFGVLKYFRDDHEKRDFVVGGASAGVAAAFGAPLGGVLFCLEEAASFWNQKLIWQTLVASVISSFTLNVVLSAYNHRKTFSYRGLFNFGEFKALPYEYFELPIFLMMGVFGGMLGALWNSVNIRLGIFRARYIRANWGKVVEAVIVAAISATVACLMMFTISDCRPLGNDPTPYPVQLFCEDNQYNAAAALWFQTPEATVKALFHDPAGSHGMMTLIVFIAIYYPLSCITYGLNVSLGIFIPNLLVGAAWGRLTADIILHTFPTWSFVDPSKYALIGAAAHLGGTLRMTISLTVIIIEATGNIYFVLPLIITLISTKWMGDYFNDGIYDTQIDVSEVPMLSWTVNPELRWCNAESIMKRSPVCVRLHEKVSYIVDILKTCPHNGFPVIDQVNDSPVGNEGRLRGFILRSQLIVILKRKIFHEKRRLWNDELSIGMFRNEYPRYESIRNVNLDDDDLQFTINCEPFMNPSPYTVTEKTSAPRLFRLFRALGLRHLVVVDQDNRVCGIITRKDLMKKS